MPSASQEAQGGRFDPGMREAFLFDSRRAIAPEHVEAHLAQRRRDWPMRSGIRDREELNAYHAQRQATRGREAVSPGVSQPVKALHMLEVTRQTITVWNRETGDREKVRKVVWAKGSFVCTPVAAFSLSPDEYYVLSYLYARIDPYWLHKHGRFRVDNVRQAEIAAHMRVSVSTVSRIISQLEAKEWLQKRQMGGVYNRDTNDWENRPNVYFLAKYENSGWTFPAGSRFSSRARLLERCKATGTLPDWEEVRAETFTHGDKMAPADWYDGRTIDFVQQRRRRARPTAADDGRSGGGPAPLGGLLPSC